MAVEWRPAVGFNLTLPSGVRARVDDVAFGVGAVPPPDNCHTIIVYNSDALIGVFIKFDLTAFAGVMDATNSTLLPPASSLSFGIGFLGERDTLNAVGGRVSMYLMGAGLAANPVVNVSYMQGKGWLGGMT